MDADSNPLPAGAPVAGTIAPEFTTRELAEGEPLSDPGGCDLLIPPVRRRGKYIVGFANSRRALEAAQRLRFQVFNLELREGLASAYESGLDHDEFDDQMTHLLLIDSETRAVVGTYRMQTAAQGLLNAGLYCAREYDLDGMRDYFDRSIECGRACLAQDHRNFSAILTLWLGIGVFMNAYRSRYLFGCCSLTTTDPDDGWRALKTIRPAGLLHENLRLPARLRFSCGPASREFSPEIGPPLPLPKLFQTYMKLGAKVISEPAIDREFGTVDFLILMDSSVVALSSLDVVR